MLHYILCKNHARYYLVYCIFFIHLEYLFINRLNSYIDIVNKYSSNYLEDEQDNDGAVTEKEYDEWVRRITLRYWKTEINGYPTLTIGELK